MSFILKFHPTHGPRRWIFRDPNTGHEFQALNKQSLINQIISYRAQNRLEEIQELGTVVDNFLCNLPENIGACVEKKDLKRGLFAFMSGGVALLRNVLYKSTVSQEVADFRAAQCVACPKNTFPDKTNFLAWADDLAVASIGDKRSKYHAQLGNCEVCTCNLRCKVFYDGKVHLTEKQIKEMEALPNGCWQVPLNGK